MGEVADLGDKRQVVTAKARRLDPGVAVLVEADNCYRMAIAASGLVLPDAGLDQAETDAVNGGLGHNNLTEVGGKSVKRQGSIMLPWLKNLSQKNLLSGSVFLRQEDGRCRPVCFCDNPEPVAATVVVNRENAGAEFDCVVIQLPIFFVEVTPVARPMADEAIEEILVIDCLQCSWSCSHLAYFELCDNAF